MNLKARVTLTLLGVCGSAIAGVGTAALPGVFRSGILTSQKGMTLYVTDQDASGSGKSSCYGPCAANWLPLKASPKARPAGDWTIIDRKDGMRQWAYKGKPVYTWLHDRKPSDETGDNFNHTWHVIRQPR